MTKVGNQIPHAGTGVVRLSFCLVLSVAAAVAAGAQARTGAPAGAQPKAVTDFMTRLDAYVAMHKKAEAASPKLPKEATPKQIDDAQRELGRQIQAARAGAKQGDLFKPDIALYITQLLARVFSGPDGVKLRSSIMDENIDRITLSVNQRYPDIIPLTTMPPEILKALPNLPEELEFRFIGDYFILLDSHSHIVPDFIPSALPKR